MFIAAQTATREAALGLRAEADAVGGREIESEAIIRPTQP
jgi:hypothetical protein